MKKILLFLSLLTISNCTTPNAPALHNVWDTVSTALRDGSYNPRLTACMSLLGVCTSTWVLKHYWNKYQLHRYQRSIEERFATQAINDFTLEQSVKDIADADYWARHAKMKRDIRERYRYSCLALGIAGAAIATKGLHALLTAR